MRIELPKDISGLKIAHIGEIEKMGRTEGHTVEQMIDYVALFSGTHKDKLMDVDIIDLQRAYIHCLRVLSDYKPKEPAKKITVKGQVYVLVPTNKQTGGWYIDVKANGKSFEDEPELVPAFNYIEKGMKYSQKDSDGNVINQLRERAKIFREYLPADVYLDLNAFFLTKLQILTNGFLILNQEQAQEMMSQMITEMK